MLRGLVIFAVAAALLFIPLQAADAACDVTPFVGASVPTKTLLLADLRGKVRIAGGDQGNIGILGGIGYTTQKIGLFDFAKRTDAGEFKGKLTGVVGLSFGAALSDRLHLSMEMVDRIRQQGAELTATTTGLVEPTQHDVMITAGLSFPLTK